MKLLYIWAFAVLVFFSASNGQNSTSETGLTSAPSVTTSLNESAPTIVDDKSENYTTPSNESAKNTEDVDNDKAETGHQNFTEAPTPNGTTGADAAIGDSRGFGDTEVDTNYEQGGGNISPTAETNGPENKSGSSWGYVILILIVLLILVLCVILVYMRRVSRTYTFDLQRPAPSHHEPIGSFEPVYLDDLDYQVHTSGMAKVAEANGTLSSTEDKELNGEVPQTVEEPTPEPGPTAETEPTPVQLLQDQQDQDQGNQDRQDQDQGNQDRQDQDQGNQDRQDQDQGNQDRQDQDQGNQDRQDQDQGNQDGRDQDLSSSPVLFIEESDEEMNVNNNNNPSTRSSGFVEINLDGPQSSVQPFNFSELQPFH